jgi:glycerate-2-kinase
MVLSADSKIKVSEGSPDNMPDEKSYEAAMQIQNLISKLKEKDILIVLISGMVNLLLVKYMYCCFIFRVFNIQGQRCLL